MMGQDPMVLNPETELFPSPIRIDKRPMIGIFHASFVLARILFAFRILEGNKGVFEIIEKTERALNDCLSVIEEHGKLTGAGYSLFESMKWERQ